ncbi:sulfite exporter TauE/SafE family protein [Streptomyces naganishii]|uniref:Probable membrane transporter protein n=1 Tax=Streptomyces naganishii JCM 4654 TaxID=1306179 RepID=A0A919CVP8_9ACTN|nr:sulfite exporter TauE/SafE family protein [Streptomyces naganishii]GHD86801.1 membrane protein [Streptomyces naganishii JCM 4654]
MTGGTAQLLLASIVTVGACVQWLTGMGFALAAVPALVLLLGPLQGVALANCAAGAISAAGLVGGWRRVRLTAMVPLVVASACTVPAGRWVAAQLPQAVLLVGMGLLVTLAVLLVMRGLRVSALAGSKGAVAAGAAGGFMNASAGLGGPPLSIYAMNADWTVHEFVPNAQFYGVVVNAFSIGANGVPQLGSTGWATAVVAMLVGAVLGKALAQRVPERRARQLVLLLALAGGVSSLAKGLGVL